jgi:hypothetical protein
MSVSQPYNMHKCVVSLAESPPIGSTSGCRRTDVLHCAQVQQSGVLGAGASEERGETARMVRQLEKTVMDRCIL